MVNGVSTLPVPKRLAAEPDITRNNVAARHGECAGFVAGTENRLLAAVVSAWCETLSDSQRSGDAWQRLTSPLVLVGSTGSGKSHLAAGLAEVAGPTEACFTTANDLRRDFATAIERGRASQWRDKLAATPLLVIDDVDHLPIRGSFQEELLYLGRELETRGHKLIVTSARPVAHLGGWLPDLVNWFSGGLTLEIAPLGAQARREVISHLANQHNWRFSPVALDHLVGYASPEPRELFRLASDLERQFGRGARFELDTLQHFLEKRKAAQAPELREIVRVVARYHQLPLKLVTSTSRQAAVVSARATAIYLARALTSASFEQIGRLLGGRDHTTIMHSYRRTAHRLAQDPALRSAMEELTRLLRR